MGIDEKLEKFKNGEEVYNPSDDDTYIGVDDDSSYITESAFDKCYETFELSEVDKINR